jgi:RNA recognition motif-containing protein
MNIFVGSLPFRMDESELREHFETYGEVESVKIITDKFTGRSRGFGFVEMPNDEEAKKAIAELNGTEIGGRAIIVNKSEERKEGGDRRDNRGGRGGGGGRGGDHRRGNY